MQFGARGAAPAQADDIETIECSDLSFGKTKRNDTCRSTAKAADHDALANADELMHRRIAAEKDIVADRDMASEHGIVGECHVVADFAIMPDMGSHHEKAARSDPRYAASAGGADIHRHAFAYLAARADDELGGFAAIMHRLRRRAERGEGINDRALADGGGAGDVDMADEAHAIFQLDMRADQTIGPDLDAIADTRAVGHARARIDRRHLSPRTNRRRFRLRR